VCAALTAAGSSVAAVVCNGVRRRAAVRSAGQDPPSDGHWPSEAGPNGVEVAPKQGRTSPAAAGPRNWGGRKPRCRCGLLAAGRPGSIQVQGALRGCRGPCRTAQPEADSQNKLNRGPAILAACFRPIRLPPVLYRASGNGRRLAGRNDHRPLDATGRSRGRASRTHPGQFARVRCTTARGCPRVASHRFHHEPIARPRPDSAVEPVSAARIPRPGAPRQGVEVRKGTAE
jgi:hypothetical protein